MWVSVFVFFSALACAAVAVLRELSGVREEPHRLFLLRPRVLQGFLGGAGFSFSIWSISLVLRGDLPPVEMTLIETIFLSSLMGVGYFFWTRET
jgi:hypothetical protein